MLVFGCRTSEDDYIYREQLESYTKSGVISDLHVAFSRQKGVEKTYVQNVVQKEANSVRAMVKEGSVFICGDAKYMGK